MIYEDVEVIKEEMIRWRRDFHQYPEVGFDLGRTVEKVTELLHSWGIEVLTDERNTGVVGIIRGNGKKTVALRADMDALPINEENEVVYKSKLENKMHACGHDGHTAMLLGAAKVLSENRDMIKGNIKFLFQPAEEGPDPGGAKPMIEEGALENVDGIFGMHLTTEYNTGTLGVKFGGAMASTDVFEITLIGKGGHAGSPHKAVDPIAMAAKVVTEIQYMVAREIDPLEPLVVSVGSIHGGRANNVIASNCKISGTIRTFNNQLRKDIQDKLKNILKNITNISGGDYELNIIDGLPPLINDDNMVEFCSNIGKKIVGEEKTILIKNPTMGAEDFAYYLQKIPGAYILLGARNEEKGFINMMHHPKFDFDEDSLVLGAKLHINLALSFLES